MTNGGDRVDRDDDRFPDLPELPSDEELGIAGLDEEELLRELEGEGKGAPPGRRPAGPTAVAPPPPPPPPSSGGRRGRPAPPGSGPPRGSWAVGLLTVVILLAGGWGASGYRALPAPVPANAPDTAFSSARAMNDLVELARGPRPVGAPEHDRARELLFRRLHELGLDPHVQTTVSLRRGGGAGTGAEAASGSVHAVTVRNLLARIPGTNPSGAILLVAHYDAGILSWGAGDDGVGVVAILEVARSLLAGGRPENDVILLLTDAEEVGLLGARAFVDAHPWMDEVRVVLNAEMRGGSGPVYLFETGAENGWILDVVRRVDPRPVPGSTSVEVYRRLPNDTDFTPFREAGVQGLNFSGIDGAWTYHQPTDRPENVSERSIQHMGTRLLAITRALGDEDLAQVNAPDRVYVAPVVVGWIGYPVGFAVPVALGVLLLWGLAAALVLRRGAGGGSGRRAGLGGVVAGSGLVLASFGLFALSAWGLLRVLPRFHPEFGTMTPVVYGEGWYMAALLAAWAGVFLALLGVMRRWFPLAPLAAGAAVLPVGLALATALVAPLMSLDFKIPALAAVVGVAAASLFGGGTRAPLPVWARILLLAAALPALAIVVPLVEGLWVALSLRAWIGLAFLSAVGFAALLPALDGAGEPNRWWAPGVAFVVSGALFAGGLLLGGPGPERPLRSTLLYAVDREEDLALRLSREDSGFEAMAELHGPFASSEGAGRFSLSDGYVERPVPIPELPATQVRVEGEVAGSLARVVRVAVEGGIGGGFVHLVLDHPEDGGPRVVAVAGEAVPTGPTGAVGARRPVTRVIHQGYPAAGSREGALLLDVEVPEGLEALEFVILEEHLDPARILGAEAFRRPPGLMPNPATRSDRLLVRTRVSLPLGDVTEVEAEPDPLPPPPPGGGSGR